MESGWVQRVMVLTIKSWTTGFLLFVISLFFLPCWPGAGPLAFGQGMVIKPSWNIGMQWEIAVRQRSAITAGDPEKSPVAVSNWIFKVERELNVDQTPTVVLSATRKSAGDHPETYQLYFPKATLTLSRVEAFPKGLHAKRAIHDFRRSAEGPTVVPFGAVPMSMPVFDTTDGEFNYTHCINGPNGFARKVAQTVEIQGTRQRVMLKSGSTQIEQEWAPGFPWPLIQSVNGGRVTAEFVTDSLQSSTAPAALDYQPQRSVQQDGIDTFNVFGPPQAGRWWPMSARVSWRPWSPSAGVKMLSVTAMSESNSTTSEPAWSGYFWPQYDDGEGVHLWDEDGPLDKYDYYVQARTGDFPSPYATTWEYENHRTLDPANAWWGHCNGWSSAAILEPEPATASWAEGIYFGVADKKGILTEWYNDTGDDGFWGGRYYSAQDDPEDIYPYEFITVLIQHIYNQDESVAADLDCKEEVWNHPIYGYYLEILEQGENENKFYCEIYYALDNVRPDFVGTSENIAKFEFWCTVDEAGNFTPYGSSWAGDSIDSHPDFLWHPTSSTRYGQGNTALEQVFVDEIMNSSPTEYASVDIQHPYRGDLTIRLGVGDSQSPDWVVTLSDQEGESAANFIADVDLSPVTEYLPPSQKAPWFLEVTDNAEGDEGIIKAFSITFEGKQYDAQELPVTIWDFQTNLSLIHPEPEPANTTPTAIAGEDQSVASGTRVTLDGGHSSDPENEIKSYLWEQTAGPTVALSTATSAQATFTAPTITAGSEILTFRLTVVDQGLLQNSDTCAITVSAPDNADGDDIIIPEDSGNTIDDTYNPGGDTNPAPSGDSGGDGGGGGGGGCFLKTTGI